VVTDEFTVPSLRAFIESKLDTPPNEDDEDDERATDDGG
jgi:hypothetical protein